MKRIATVLLSVLLFFTIFSSPVFAEASNPLLVQKIFTSEKKVVFLNCYYFLGSQEENERTKNSCTAHINLIKKIENSGLQEVQNASTDVFFSENNLDGLRDSYLVEVGGNSQDSNNTIPKPNTTTVTNNKTETVNHIPSEDEIALAILLTKEQEEK